MVLYGVDPALGTLNMGRSVKFCQKLANSKAYISPEKLPPTSDTGYQHSLRAFRQVQEWLGVQLDPLLYGLETIHCGCETGCRTPSRCKCLRNNLQCTLACSSCRGITCSNAVPVDHDDN